MQELADEKEQVDEEIERRRKNGIVVVFFDQFEPLEFPYLICLVLKLREGMRKDGNQEINEQHIGDDLSEKRKSEVGRFEP